MSKTIIFCCDEYFHIESSTDYNYICALKQDYNNKILYIICSDIGIILEQYGNDHCVNQCTEMVSVLQQKNGTCIVYKTDSAFYDYNGNRILY